MDEAEAALQAQLPAALRQLNHSQLQPIHHPQPSRALTHHGHSALAGQQLPPELHGLDPIDPGNFQQRLTGVALDDPSGQLQHAGGDHPDNPLQHSGEVYKNTPRVQQQGQQHLQVAGGAFGLPPQTPQRIVCVGGIFGVLSPAQALLGQSLSPHDGTSQFQQEQGDLETPDQRAGKSGHIDNLKMVPDPPNLQEWRQRLFDVNETITLTEDQFSVYFPHVDNIYSHRSTQRYKRKPFVSHYWDCRLKGRPPGTPKSDDPTKKKRKRTARERDLCDVKIKITEYLASTTAPPGFHPASDPNSIAAGANNFFAPGQPGAAQMQGAVPGAGAGAGAGVFHLMTANTAFSSIANPHIVPQRYFTIQRVNGNGGNGKGDGVAGPHKHSLEDSDRVKKNSVQRWMVKEDKEKKKTQPTISRLLFKSTYSVLDKMADMNVADEQKTYHKRATGAALATVKRHSKESLLVLYGSCFCPFVQRVWISLEAKNIAYQYVEVDPYKKPASLLELNPRGLVPAVRHGSFSCYESTVLMEYLEDLASGPSLLPQASPQLRAHCRLWTDHINRHIIPGFYQTLQAQDIAKQIEAAEQLKTDISKLVDVADPTGPFFMGPDLGFVDIQFAPWMLRLSRVLKPYRGWPDAEQGSRWGRWLEAVEGDECVRATTSGDELYKDSYERYAENRKDTSQLANAVNAGRGLP